MQALATAVIVCYWRPFSQRNTAGHLRAKDAIDAVLHKQMKTWRDEAGAHIDLAGGRTAEVTPFLLRSGEPAFLHTESEWEFPPEDQLPRIIEVAEQQTARFRAEAIRPGVRP